ncbi:HPF/RaiA family ribosome-associated protein [Vibrio chagasii]|nr:HPF/RaiA family ribosome-associated protein [Vibrio chagasii]
MKINVQTHHVSINDDSRNKDIEGKFERYLTFFHTDQLRHHRTKKNMVNIGLKCSTSEKVYVHRHQATDDVMYLAISSAIKKLEAGLSNRKGQLKKQTYTRNQQVPSQGPLDIIQEMKLV